jgi:hypothetical protein
MTFLRSTTTLKTADLLSSLMQVAEGDDRVSYHLWVLVFPIIWTSLMKNRQQVLAKPIINLISKFSEEIAQEAYQPRDRRDGKRVSHLRVWSSSYHLAFSALLHASHFECTEYSLHEHSASRSQLHLWQVAPSVECSRQGRRTWCKHSWRV